MFDEHFFNHIYKKINESNKPQFAIGLSTTNHPPYTVPNEFKPQNLKITNQLKSRGVEDIDLVDERFKSFQYANLKLSQFISKIKNSKLGKNTIIAVTEDHNFWSFINYSMEENFEKFKVPFYLYIPTEFKPDNYKREKFGSHEDIMPTLYNVSLSNTKYLAFGRDLFGYQKTYALNSNIFASDEGLMYHSKFYNWKNDSTLVNPKAIEKPLKGIDTYQKSTFTVADFF